MAKIYDVIQYEGDNTTFIWKHPTVDFNSGTQLIVHESQEALFYMNGQALDLFGPGRYTLETQNIPLVGKYLNRPTNDISPFHCEVYFINKTMQMGIKWGTDSKIEYMEPTYQFPIQLGASGEMIVQCDDARLFLVKVVGTEPKINQDMLVQKFRAFLMVHLKTYLATLIKEKNISVFSIDEQLVDISIALQEKLSHDFGLYGIKLERFFVTTIVKPEEDRMYQTFKALHFRQYADVAEAKIRQEVGLIDQQTSAQRMVIEAQGLAQKRSMEGYTYQEERRYDVAEKVAENEATGEFANMGIGLGLVGGIGAPMGQAVGGIVGESLTQMASPLTLTCPSCGQKQSPQARFCSNCGHALGKGE